MILSEKDLQAFGQSKAIVPEAKEEPELKIEFDGTTVLCRVCGDKASGFHYGVHSCEGCKGFFRRSIQQKIQYRPCTKNQQCSILRINRNRCQYCRLRKCIAVGMSRDEMKTEDDQMDTKEEGVQLNHLPILKGILDGVVEYHNAPVRFGRVPKREKARILAAMHQSCQSRSAERAAVAEQLNGVAPNQLSSPANPSAAPAESGNPANQQGHVEGEAKEEPGTAEWKEQAPVEEDDELEANRLANTVLRAHSDTCHFAHLRPKEGQGCPRAGPVYSVQGRNGPILACPLNPRRPLVAGLTPDPTGRGEDTLLQDFSQRFSPAIRGVVEFAKRIPGFALLSQSDQVTLLKAGVFEVLLLRLACLFDAQTNTMTCLNGELLRRESIVSHSPSSSPSHSPSHTSNARFLVDSMFEFAARLNSLQLSDAELALFSAVVIIAPDRPGLRHTDLISRIHNRLLSSLSLLLTHSHPSPPALLSTLQSYIPDLRTLNTLHSEKLLAFKMTEQQNQSEEQNMHQPCVQDLDQQQHYAAQGRPQMVQQHGRPQNCPAHAIPQCPVQDGLGQHQTDSWKDDDVQEVEDDEIIEEEERWRATRNASISAVMSGLKSPLGSVSSSESICSGEVASLSEFRTSVSASAPLLAASLSGNSATINAMVGFPKRRRHRDRSGSNSEEDTSCSGIQSNPCTTQVAQMSTHRTYFRKLDSPSDSGIESGTERLEKSSTSTSVCSSPRSSLEDKDEALMQQHKVAVATQPQRRCPHLERPSAVEDMPVLKRVLQAPPLYDTNSLMDEAYKPHKKFRALRKDCAEAEAMGNSPPGVPSSPGMVAESPRPCRIQDKSAYASLEPVNAQESNLPSPPIVVLSPPSTAAQPASPHSIISTLNMHFPQITIHAQPMRNPSPMETNPGTNRLSPHSAGTSNPPLLLQKALLQPPANQRSLQSHQHQALLSALSGDTSPRPASSSPLTASLLAAPALSSSLSSTHSTLARSLMEGPKMTAEQMKRTDIIHSYIMRENSEEVASGSQAYRKACPQAQGYQTKSSPEPTGEDSYRKQPYRSKEQTSAGVLVFNGSYLHMGWSNSKQGPMQETQGYSSPSPKPPTEVKQAGQPLNLSKKTPPPSPATTPVAPASVLEA